MGLVPGTDDAYIEIMPVGDVAPELLEFTADVVEQRFGMRARVSRRAVPPEDAFDPARGQHNATVLLQFISRHRDSESLKTLGVVDLDIFSPGLNYVFGQAVLGGCCGIISLVRLRQGVEQSGDAGIFLQRIEKEAVHELGHAFGLRHCADPRCVMYFSSNIADTDYKSAEFCAECGLPSVRQR